MPALKALTVIGLNSGTSMDGVDAAIFRIVPKIGQNAQCAAAIPTLDIQMLDSILYPLEPALQRQMQAMIHNQQTTLEHICRLNVALGEVFASSALALIKKAGLTTGDVDLIGSHGQTLWHAPTDKNFAGIETRATLQLGEAAIIAARTGIEVISDFRPRDMAEGGQGAPIVSFADEVLFGAQKKATGVLNIGGIANLTVVDASGEAVTAFDTGPGNLLIDRLTQKLFGKEYDENGALAAQGKVDEQWLNELLQHPYFLRKPPKTTGRELFSFAFADQLITDGRQRKLSDEDLLATTTALTAAAIVAAYEHFIRPETRIEQLVLGGGGADNGILCAMLKHRWPDSLTMLRHEDFGISTKFKEALLFALLAYTTHFGIANNVPRCTGARRRVCLGKITLP